MKSGNTLVVYYSRPDENYNVGTVEVGNTELLAKEMTEQSRPEYIGDIDISKYDNIFLGYPIWWGDLPMIVYTFLDKHDFSDKTVIPFNTHDGSWYEGANGRGN
ncbi:hypothetical protein IJF91_00020 [Candidatus Saccharibacteria bacterium]|nr:hypothetical protein [Candidatus Saccharibacteria bacterium]